MKALIELSCCIYNALTTLYASVLRQHYGEEMQLVFRDQITEASNHSLLAMARVWSTVATETISLLGPAYGARLGLVAASITCSTALLAIAALGFCTLGPVTVVHGYSVTAIETQADPSRKERLVTIPGGKKIFLTCREPRTIHGISTVILATGRGIGDHTGWAPVQQAASQFARVCSYDPLGTGQSDKLPAGANIDDLTDQMHALFEAANLPKPYVLVGTSLGGVLTRRYETHYPAEVAGFVFADSAHEEMEWRDAAIAENFDPVWNDPKYLRDNGLLSIGELSQWHDDVPIVVLERSERAPCEAFPSLTLRQCNGINDAWHSFQVDLSHRSKHAQLRIIQGAGHSMVLQKPEAVAQAIKDVLVEMGQQ
jgi:pimeloyl-ACP methyl ester carboxylesterase